MDEENPVKEMMFYTKKDLNKAKPITDDQFSQILPERFCEVNIRVYCKNPNKEELAQRYIMYFSDVISCSVSCVDKWCKKHDYTTTVKVCCKFIIN